VNYPTTLQKLSPHQKSLRRNPLAKHTLACVQRPTLFKIRTDGDCRTSKWWLGRVSRPQAVVGKAISPIPYLFQLLPNAFQFSYFVTLYSHNIYSFYCTSFPFCFLRILGYNLWCLYESLEQHYQCGNRRQLSHAGVERHSKEKTH